MKNDTEGHKNGIKNENTVSDTIKKNLKLNKKKKIKSEKEETLKDMLKEVDNETKREEIIHMLLEQKVSKVIKEEEDEKSKFSYKALREVPDLLLQY